jgi:hypothetical protein
MHTRTPTPTPNQPDCSPADVLKGGATTTAFLTMEGDGWTKAAAAAAKGDRRADHAIGRWGSEGNSKGDEGDEVFPVGLGGQLNQ